MSRSDEVRARQAGGTPESAHSAALQAWIDLIEKLQTHAKHPWEQVGQCVYCAPCSMRLYQGTPLNESEKLDLLKEEADS